MGMKFFLQWTMLLFISLALLLGLGSQAYVMIRNRAQIVEAVATHLSPAHVDRLQDLLQRFCKERRYPFKLAHFEATQIVPDEISALYLAVNFGDMALTQSLLDLKVDVNLLCDYGRTPLYRAAKDDYLDIVEALIAAKADVNVACDNGETPLLIASYMGDLNTVKALISAKADVNYQANNGASPLLIAALHGHLDIVTVLLEADADRNLPIHDGTTPLDFALKNGHLAIANVLQSS